MVVSPVPVVEVHELNGYGIRGKVVSVWPQLVGRLRGCSDQRIGGHRITVPARVERILRLPRNCACVRRTGGPDRVFPGQIDAVGDVNGGGFGQIVRSAQAQDSMAGIGEASYVIDC